ncbi:hypothetical protein N7533_001557 [Penicillium manginii]|uniref:uncharacterized protein n=1 Tax=Penicillium manginii TaxID=203109 RepID=UPI0025477E68|nr:uncharacterized protein N7533_001557 [Penicillium manginii]KAJ5762876.1 hypothetical protein N7533_001557 [Penicillium manginii]
MVKWGQMLLASRQSIRSALVALSSSTSAEPIILPPNSRANAYIPIPPTATAAAIACCLLPIAYCPLPVAA